MEPVYLDDGLVVAEKPVGLDSEREFPQALEARIGGKLYPVHRLDKSVSGLMVYARTPQAAAELSRQMREGEFRKEYVALVHGTPPEEGAWTDLLFRDSRANKVYVVKRTRKGVREARLSFTRLRAGAESLVRIRLETGRSHQIRVQFASRGYPLVGDRRYGGSGEYGSPMLYCCRLAFSHGGRPLVFEKLPNWAE